MFDQQAIFDNSRPAELYADSEVPDVLLSLITGQYQIPAELVTEALSQVDSTDMVWSGSWIGLSMQGQVGYFAVIDPSLILAYLNAVDTMEAEVAFFNNADYSYPVSMNVLETLAQHLALIPISPSGKMAPESVQQLAALKPAA